MSARSCMLAALALAAVAHAGCSGTGGPPPGPAAPAEEPIVSYFYPRAGGPGAEVHILGHRFAGEASGNAVSFQGVPATVLSASSGKLVVAVPPGARSGSVEVATAHGRGTSADAFAVLGGSEQGAAFTTRLLGPPHTPLAITAGAGGLVAVGLGIHRSADGRVWSNEIEGFVGYSYDVAWDGRGLATVGEGHAWSPEGLLWNSSNWCCAELYAVTSSGSHWAAVGSGGVGYGGLLVHSADGITWELGVTVTGVAPAVLRGVAWDGSQFVAVGDSGALLTSPDGDLWTVHPPPTPEGFTAVAASGTALVAATPSTFWASTDGIRWTEQGPTPARMERILHAGGRFVAVGANGTAISTDGLAWTASPPVPAALSGVAHTASEWVAVGLDRSGGAVVLASPDGLSWSARSTNRPYFSVAVSPAGLAVAPNGPWSQVSSDGGATWTLSFVDPAYLLEAVWAPPAGGFLAVGSKGTVGPVYRSTDGVTWSRLADIPCSGTLAASDATVVAVGWAAGGSCLATSPDGVAWTAREVPPRQGLERAFWTGGQFVAVGLYGAIATSPDGLTWTARRAGGSGNSLHAAAASPSLLLAVGDRGTILTSPDGAVWTERASGTTAALRGVAWTGSAFFAVGDLGTVLRSADGVAWTALPTPWSSLETWQMLYGVAWEPGTERLILVGSDGLVATSP